MQAQALDKSSCSYKTNLVKLDRESKDFAGVVAYEEAVLFVPPLHRSRTPLVSLHHELLHLRGERERERLLDVDALCANYKSFIHQRECEKHMSDGED